MELWQGQSQTTNVKKNERKCAINKGSTTKPTPSQPNTMLEGSNDEHGNKVKSKIRFTLSKVGKWKHSLFFNFNVDQRYSNGAEVLGPLATNKVMLNIMKNHMFQAIDGNHVKVSSSIEILLIVPSMIKTNVQTLKPGGVDERLNLQCGED